MAVELDPISARFWEVWRVLDASRTWIVGLGGSVPSPIPVSEITGYAERVGLKVEEAVEVIQHLDLTWRTRFFQGGASEEPHE